MTDTERENEELKNALKKIKYHLDQINSIMSEISDKLKDEDEQISESDVKKLLQKYSRL
ncbi:MAG: hypothetical protein IJT49_02235 [Clostridia bacterium]|nr:hypothetical protein [Clostridia bacterium]